jgi:hypothetical protein
VTGCAHEQSYTVMHPRLRSAILRKRIMGVFIFVFGAVMLTVCYYYQSSDMRRNGDWSWFWGGEVIVGVWLVLRIVLVLRWTPKQSWTGDPITAHKWSVRNRSDLQKSDLCGCFHCLAVFAPNEIQDWTHDGETALCPKCGVDSVIGSISEYPIQSEFLSRMHDHWF